MLRIHQMPQGEAVSEDFHVILNEEYHVMPYTARVSAIPFNQVWPGYQRPLEQTELSSFIYFTMNRDVRVHLIANKDFEEAVVRPLSKNIKPVKNGRNITFTIPEPGQYTVELDGFHNALHIFANPDFNYDIPEDNIYKDKNIIYYGAGIHKPGKIELKSGQTLMIDEGAVVYGSVVAHNADNIRIIGTGILDNSEEERENGNGCMKFFNCKNIEVKGIICRDSVVWTATLFNCDNMLFDNMKTIGMWRYNSDGIDFVNSANGIIQNCFLRNFDDVVVLKGLKGWDTRNVENILVRKCVLWCDWGRALEIGAETCADEYRNILFEDCDIIHGDCILMDFQNGDRAKVHDVRFENIRVEYNKYALPPVYQQSKEMEYKPDLSKCFVPLLFKAHLYCGMWSKDYLYGENSNINIKNIYILADKEIPMPMSHFVGINAEHMTKNIVIDGLYFNGKRIESLEEGNIVCGEFTENIVLH
ncbi:MAG: hypothetical protein K0S55_1907 [Clostridia bacterium]|nr:hypothetical protein [Clostridia bacterium]